jgi:fermentation-respiration switch protein FrsA (DUF1100 family)
MLGRASVGGFTLVLLVYGAIIIWFRANEDHLVFLPEPGPLTPPPAGFGLDPERVELSAPDGPRLVAWRIPPPGSDSAALWILVLHGNAGNLATPGRPAHDRQLRDLGLGVLALDYRGYGESTGTPTEAGLYTDARAAYDYLRGPLAVPARRIVIYGHSLGSGVAVELATTVEAAGLIVEGGFTSVPDRAAEAYPWLPVHLMAHNRFASLERIGMVGMPVLVIHGRDDATIPIRHGRRLFAAAREPKEFLEVAGGHDDAYQVGRVEYEAGLRRFLARVR